MSGGKTSTITKNSVQGAFEMLLGMGQVELWWGGGKLAQGGAQPLPYLLG